MGTGLVPDPVHWPKKREKGRGNGAATEGQPATYTKV
jgi:hypothetical protein